MRPRGVHTTHRVNRDERGEKLHQPLPLPPWWRRGGGAPTWATAPEAIGVVGNWEKICPMSRPKAFLNMRRVWRLA